MWATYTLEGQRSIIDAGEHVVRLVASTREAGGLADEAMSQENVEVVWRWAPVIERADPAGYATMIDAIFAPDAEWIEDPRWPSSATGQGTRDDQSSDP
jgi:hypothetical protein